MPTINFISFEKCKILYFEYKNSRENKKKGDNIQAILLYKHFACMKFTKAFACFSKWDRSIPL